MKNAPEQMHRGGVRQIISRTMFILGYRDQPKTARTSLSIFSMMTVLLSVRWGVFSISLSTDLTGSMGPS